VFINLDANASCSVLPEVKASVADHFLGQQLLTLNPSSIHKAGQLARALVEEARAEIRQLLGLTSHARVVFTSGATEANNLAILSPFLTARTARQEFGRGFSIVTSSVEHQSVLGPVALAESWGNSVARISVSEEGVLSEEQLFSALGADTKLVSLMLANNETGHLFPVSSFTAAIRERSPLAFIHSDGVQLVGKGPVSFPELGVDALTISGHKLGALGGVGALILAEGAHLEPLVRGGAQEGYLRAGTENVMGIVSLGAAAKVLRATLSARVLKMREGSHFLRALLAAELPQVRFNTPEDGALPNTLSLTIPGVPADDLVVALDLEGVCISSGAACSSGKPLPSHVLIAMGRTLSEARSTIRLSLEAGHDLSQLERAARVLIHCVKRFSSVFRSEGAAPRA
jgi:cysteine desulfurase